jgi:hypothetical protein
VGIKCLSCGFDDNRDIAHFCRQCGEPLTASPPAPTPSHSAALQIASSPPPMLTVSGPPAQQPAWKHPPQVEGRILHVDGPHKGEKGGLAGRFALGLALSRISPFLGWLPFMARTDLDVRYVRVLDAHSGQQRSVKMVGEPSSDVDVGDMVAFWGKDEEGALKMQSAYNHNTGALIRLKR